MGEREYLRVVDGERHDDGLTAYEVRTYDERAEQAVIASLVVDPALLVEVGFLRAEHFRSEAHRQMYVALRALEARGSAIDGVSFASELRAMGRLQQVGGVAYVTEIQNSPPLLAARHLVTHARRVRDLAVRRQLFALSLEFRGRVEVGSEDEASVIQHVFSRLYGMVDELSASEQGDRVDDVAHRMLAELAAIAAHAGESARPTGFRALDAMIAGLHNELLIIGARPGMGKTAIACAIASNVAGAGDGVYIASLETRQETLLLRMACARAGLEVHRARVGALSTDEWSRFTKAAAELAALPLWVDDAPGTSVMDLWAKCRRAQLQLASEKRKLALVVVDYVQLLRAARPGMKREEVVAENARALKAMAQDLSVSVLALAQLNREVDKRADKRPELSDLRESGELEQCARTVLLLYRADYYFAKRRGYQPTGIVEANVAKQNNGPTGIVRLRFVDRTTAFSDGPAHVAGCRCPACSTDGPVADEHETLGDWVESQNGGRR